MYLWVRPLEETLKREGVNVFPLFYFYTCVQSSDIKFAYFTFKKKITRPVTNRKSSLQRNEEGKNCRFFYNKYHSTLWSVFFSWIYLFICFLFSLRASIDVEIKPFEKIIGLDCRGQLWQAAGYGGIKTQVKCNQESIIGICFSSIGKYVFFFVWEITGT